jgi:hypothetical protein
VFSPDGRWVAYQSQDADARAVYVEPVPRTGAKYLVPLRGGQPFWSPKGNEIIMNTSPTTTAVVAVTATPRVEFSRPGDFPRVGRLESNPTTGRRNVDMMPDGQYVVGVMTSGTINSAQTPQTREQRRMLIDKLPDAANLSLGALVFGQFLGERPFSIPLAILGLVTWAAFFGGAFVIGGTDQ